MQSKTIFIIILTAIFTIFLMMNTDAVEFNFIFATADISKLVVVGVFTLLGFILGYWVAKPKTVISSYDDERTAPAADPKNTLTDEDRDYIS